MARSPLLGCFPWAPGTRAHVLSLPTGAKALEGSLSHSPGNPLGLRTVPGP